MYNDNSKKKGTDPEHPPGKSCTLSPSIKTMFIIADYSLEYKEKVNIFR